MTSNAQAALLAAVTLKHGEKWTPESLRDITETFKDWLDEQDKLDTAKKTKEVGFR